MLKKLLTKPTAADLLADVKRAKGVVSEKYAAVVAAEAAVAAALAELDAVAHERASSDLATARTMLASAKEFAAAAEERRAEAVVAEAEEEWKREVVAHNRAVAAFEKEARTALAEMSEAARRIVSRSAGLEADWRALTARRPADAAPPKHPETWRHLPATEDEVVDEKVAPEWCFAGTGRPIGEEAARRVTPHEGGRTGRLGTGSGMSDVVLRRVRRRTVRPRRPTERAEPLAAALAVPGATAADRPGWTPCPPDEVAVALDRLAAPAVPRQRETRAEVEVLPD